MHLEIQRGCSGSAPVATIQAFTLTPDSLLPGLRSQNLPLETDESLPVQFDRARVTAAPGFPDTDLGMR